MPGTGVSITGISSDYTFRGNRLENSRRIGSFSGLSYRLDFFRNQGQKNDVPSGTAQQAR